MAEEEANKLKDQGNKHLQSGDYDKAISCYSEAIELCPKNHVLFSNRSAAFAKKGMYQESFVDAERTTQLNPTWGKGYSRLGTALAYLGRYAKAKEAYETGLKHDPNNEQLKSGLEDVKSRISSSSRPTPGGTPSMSPFSGPGVKEKLLADPSTKEMMSDPSFLKILNDLATNPETLKLYINDQRVMKALGVILGINVQMAEGDEEDESMSSHTEEKPHREEPKAQEKPKSTTANKETDAQKQALEEKQKGNDAYKKKDFENALLHYEKAIELDPKNITFLTNRAAVFYEQGKMDECIKQCEDAIEVGRSNHAGFKLIAKAFARIGNAHFSQEHYEEALRFYQKSLTEFRDPDTVKRCLQTEKIMKKKAELAYQDKDKADEERNKGNEFFSNGDYPQAVKHYTESLRRNPEDPRTYSNRAACYTKLAEFRMALKDCEECLRLNPDFIKGYLRKGAVLVALKDNTKAADAFKKALELDPNCKEAQDGLYNSMSTRHSANPEDRMKEALNDPEVQSIMMDPAMRMILEQMQNDPKAAAEHLKNPDVAKKIQKLMQSGILSMR